MKNKSALAGLPLPFCFAKQPRQTLWAIFFQIRIGFANIKVQPIRVVVSLLLERCLAVA